MLTCWPVSTEFLPVKIRLWKTEVGFSFQKSKMTSRVILSIVVLAICGLVAVATSADAEDAERTLALRKEHEQHGLLGALLTKRVAGEEVAEAVTDYANKRRRRGKGKKRGRKGRGKGRGKGGKTRGNPIYEKCIHHITGVSCVCDMRYENIPEDPEWASKYYTIC